MSEKSIVIEIKKLPKKGMWQAMSRDVPGLILECETKEQLKKCCEEFVPELILANSPDLKYDRIEYRKVSAFWCHKKQRRAKK